MQVYSRHGLIATHTVASPYFAKSTVGEKIVQYFSDDRPDKWDPKLINSITRDVTLAPKDTIVLINSTIIVLTRLSHMNEVYVDETGLDATILISVGDALKDPKYESNPEFRKLLTWVRDAVEDGYLHADDTLLAMTDDKENEILAGILKTSDNDEYPADAYNDATEDRDEQGPVGDGMSSHSPYSV